MLSYRLAQHVYIPRHARAFQSSASLCKAPHGLSDEAIASQANIQPISAIAKASFGMGENDLELYGKYKAKLPFSFVDSLSDKPNGKLILTTVSHVNNYLEGVKLKVEMGRTTGRKCAVLQF